MLSCLSPWKTVIGPVLLFCLFVPLLVSGEVPSYTVGVLAKHGNARTMEMWNLTFGEFLTEQSKAGWSENEYSFSMLPIGFEEFSDAIDNKLIDFVFANSALSVKLGREHGMNMLMTLINRRGCSHLFQFGGVLVAKASSNISKWEDCVGKRIGAVDYNSFGGFLMQRYEFRSVFNDQKYFGTHPAVGEAVLNGSIDCGAMRSDTIERLFSSEESDFRVLNNRTIGSFPFLLSTMLYPEWPISAVSSVPAEVQSFVEIALSALGSDTKAAIAGEFIGFVPHLAYKSVETCLLDQGWLVNPEETDDSDNSPERMTTTMVILTIALGVMVIALALLAMLLLRKRRVETKRLLKNAPVGLTDPFLLIFTDIEESTKLWEKVPTAIMNQALDLHNEVIRKAIQDYSGYEVKTQGDSFFVVFQNPLCGVFWAIDIQDRLLRAKWPIEVVEAMNEIAGERNKRRSMMGLESMNKMEKTPGSVGGTDASMDGTGVASPDGITVKEIDPSSSHLKAPRVSDLFMGEGDENGNEVGAGQRREMEDERGEVVWNGFRVRIGGDCGLPDCVKDRETHRMDYFGPDVNRAARIGSMAHGGQILLGESMQHLLEDIVRVSQSPLCERKNTRQRFPSISCRSAESVSGCVCVRELPFVFNRIGEFELKGVALAQNIIEITPTHLAERRFSKISSEKGSMTGGTLLMSVPNRVFRVMADASSDLYSIYQLHGVLPWWLNESNRNPERDVTLSLLQNPRMSRRALHGSFPDKVFESWLKRRGKAVHRLRKKRHGTDTSSQMEDEASSEGIETDLSMTPGVGITNLDELDKEDEM
jgi:class 3 adenylate cyclase